MLESITFDLVLGMVFVFLLLSLVIAAVREAIEARLRTRSKLLAHAIWRMLGDEATEKLYGHPLILALYDGKYDPKATSFAGFRYFSWLRDLPLSIVKPKRMPAYIPARTFALVLLNLVASGDLWTVQKHDNGSNPGEMDNAAVNQASTSTLTEQVRLALGQNNDGLARGLMAALSAAGINDDSTLQAVQNWYDAAMDRVSGWYKRETQHILFWLGLAVAIAMNVDSIALTRYLASSPEARQTLASRALAASEVMNLPALVEAERKHRAAVAAATSAEAPQDAIEPGKMTIGELHDAIKAADSKVSDAIRSVTDLNLPIGWTRTRANDFFSWGDAGITSLSTMLGWLLTAFGLSFGAPFWFDMLNKVMVVRSTVKPHEKSPEEASEDGK